MPSSAVDETVPVPDTIIAGRYRIIRALGVGAMGVVVEARHMQLEQRVAIKFLRADLLDRPEMLQRFDREAKAAARLRGEHVTHVLDVGIDDRGVPFFVMEYLRGDPLSTLMSKTPQMPFESVASLMIEACAGLAEAHALRIVHRDVKPENLFLTVLPDGTRKLKILDFGVSKVALTGSVIETDVRQTDTMVGSPLYMSPEQVRAAKIDARSDFWSLGVTMFEMLAGRPPFMSDSLVQVCGMVLEAEIPDVRTYRADCPPELAAIVAKCLRRLPSERFANAGELAMALAPLASARAALTAGTAVALAKRSSVYDTAPDDDLPPEDGDQARDSALEAHIAARSGSSSRPGMRSTAGHSKSGIAPRGSKRWIPLVAFLLLAGLGATAWMMKSASDKRDAATARSATDLPPPPPSASAAPPASATEVPSTDAGVGAPSTATSVSAPTAAPIAPRPGAKVGGPIPKTEPKPTAKPGGGDLDIRLTR